MNDYQMNSLANDHRRQLTHEAQQQRLASLARQPRPRSHQSEPRRPIRLSLGLLLRRSAV